MQPGQIVLTWSGLYLWANFALSWKPFASKLSDIFRKLLQQSVPWLSSKEGGRLLVTRKIGPTSPQE